MVLSELAGIVFGAWKSHFSPVENLEEGSSSKTVNYVSPWRLKKKKRKTKGCREELLEDSGDNDVGKASREVVGKNVTV